MLIKMGAIDFWRNYHRFGQFMAVISDFKNIRVYFITRKVLFKLIYYNIVLPSFLFPFILKIFAYLVIKVTKSY